MSYNPDSSRSILATSAAVYPLLLYTLENLLKVAVILVCAQKDMSNAGISTIIVVSKYPYIIKTPFLI